MGSNGCDNYHKLLPGEMCAMHQLSCFALGITYRAWSREISSSVQNEAYTHSEEQNRFT